MSWVYSLRQVIPDSEFQSVLAQLRQKMLSSQVSLLKLVPRYWKRIWSKFTLQRLTAKESLHSFLRCAAAFPPLEMHGRKGSNYVRHSTLLCWSRMSSVTLLRTSLKLKPDNVFPFLLCTSFMKLVKSELKGQKETDVITDWHYCGCYQRSDSLREHSTFRVWFTAVEPLKDTNFANQLYQVPASNTSQ